MTKDRMIELLLLIRVTDAIGDNIKKHNVLPYEDKLIDTIKLRNRLNELSDEFINPYIID